MSENAVENPPAQSLDAKRLAAANEEIFILQGKLTAVNAEIKKLKKPKDQLEIFFRRNRGSRERLNDLLIDAMNRTLGVAKKSVVKLEFVMKPYLKNGAHAFETTITSDAKLPPPDFPARVFYANDDLTGADIEDTRQSSFEFSREEEREEEAGEIDPDKTNPAAPAYR